MVKFRKTKILNIQITVFPLSVYSKQIQRKVNEEEIRTDFS